MDRKGQMAIGMFVVMFIIAVLGISLFTASLDTSGSMTSKQVTTNLSDDVSSAFNGSNEVLETVNFTMYSQSDWKKLDCPLTSVAIRNGAGTALVANTDYTLYASEGVYSLLNTTKTVPKTSLNTTYLDFTYCADGYNKDSGSRAMVNLIIIGFALAIAFAVLEKSGLTNLTGWFN